MHFAGRANDPRSFYRDADFFVLPTRHDPCSLVVLEALAMSVTDGAKALGVSRNALSELVNERRGISPEMAVRLSMVFGCSAESWLAQQAQYDLANVDTDRMKLKRLELV